MSTIYDGDFMFGNICVSLITLMTIVSILVKICIFDRSLKGEEQMIKIWWLCCLRIGKK